MLNKDTFKGLSLFNDIEDQALRTRNRAVILTNLACDHTKNKLITSKGSGLILGYFGLIPQEERKDVQEAFQVNMAQRGYALIA